MYPLKPYRPMYQKFGLIPLQEYMPVSYPVQTFTIYALIAPLIFNNPEITQLVLKHKNRVLALTTLENLEKTK